MRRFGALSKLSQQDNSLQFRSDLHAFPQDAIGVWLRDRSQRVVRTGGFYRPSPVMDETASLSIKSGTGDIMESFYGLISVLFCL